MPSSKNCTEKLVDCMKSENKRETPTLRQKAERLLNMRTLPILSELPVAEIQRLVMELEINRIELELQNEALIQAKEQTELSVEKYAELYDFAPTGYFALSRHGEILEANLCGSQMLDRERSRLISARFGFFVSEETRSLFNHFLDKVFTGNTNESCEVTLLTERGTRLFVQLNAIHATRQDQCLITVADISRIKQAEASLVASESEHRNNFIFLHSILESPTSIIIFSLDSNYCYTAFTKFHQQTMKKLWGIEIQSGMNMLAAISISEDREKAKKNFDRALSGEYFIRTEEYGDEKLTRTFYEDYYSPLKDSEGNIVGLSVFVIDITEREANSLEIKHKNEELQRLNNEKDKFFSIISHDLRAPFNGFLGLTEIMAEGLSQMTLDEIQSLAIMMKESASNLYRLLGNLLEWSQMQRGLITFAPRPFLLTLKIAESIVNSVESARKKEIDFRLDIPTGLSVVADMHMFESIIRNLCSNAVKFTCKGGKITISAKSISVDSVEISIRDTGIGMAPEMIDNLFSLDIITNRKGTENEPSSGLGLILCKDFIQKHGSKLKVTSKVRKGSTFSFTLPSSSVTTP